MPPQDPNQPEQPINPQQPPAPQAVPPQPMAQPGMQYGQVPPAQGGSNVIGILSIVLAFVFVPAGLILSIIAMKKGGTNKTLGIIGLVLSILGLLVSGVLILLTLTTASGIQSKAQDTKYSTDIRSIQTQLEANFANDNSYPSLDQLNSETWRQTHMAGISPEALSPNSSQTQLVSGAATDSAYSYTPSPSGCSDDKTNPCTSYALSALQKSGQTYSVQSLN